ncbi:endonuclease I [Virgibacillus phasianinus]|uniref:Endonuclease I n=1 Tax=Virgibacillus phasianinus TaxID=2017483 RepID=A0A220TZE8_9BACI|nr:endonuclease [Virgibacillus phasianinus]ASK61208.1 endonuclease I [Virgibacillus phasianinus]
MNLTDQQKKRFLPVTTDQKHQSMIRAHHRKMKVKMQQDEKVYYDAEKDKLTIEQYYQGIDFENDEGIRQSLEQLLKDTHSKQLDYDPSEHVYPWVDLRPNGNLTSIYSGKNRQPEEVIQEDYATSVKREKEIEKTSNTDHEKLKQIEKDFKYNCEHAVPQSWFNEQEPMRGDLHHLFTCEPVCNSIRSNYPYHDFTDYNPGKMRASRIEEACGKAEEELFEPEFGKGTVARAMLYFLIRYPEGIEQAHKEEIDTKILLDWHQKFPPEIYEKHRNQAIYEMQGNRNPFIDFPEKMSDMFPL